MKDVNSICKLVECSRCFGSGSVSVFPHYSTPMPERVKEECEDCRGRGELVLVSWRYNVTKDTSFGDYLLLEKELSDD